MTGKSLGVVVGVLACVTLGYGFGSGWIKLGPPERPEPPMAVPHSNVERSGSADLDLAVVRASNPAGVLAASTVSQKPALPVPVAGVTPPAAPAPAAGATPPAAPTPPTAVTPPAAPKIESADFQFLPDDLIPTVMDAAQNPLEIDARGVITSDGPTLTLGIALDRINGGIEFPADATTPIPMQVTITLAKPGAPPFSPAASAMTFPATLSLAPDSSTAPDGLSRATTPSAYQRAKLAAPTTFLVPRGIVKFRGWKESGGVGLLETVHEDGSSDQLLNPTRSVQRPPLL
jgi:hypothetical protein